jgi:hypothetical protein
MEANHIARWDGSSWSALGSGVSHPVNVLSVYDNELIAAGDFTTAGDMEANYIARWDGSSWLPLGSGMNDEVSALAVYNDELIAGGYFNMAGGKVSACVAFWSLDMADVAITSFSGHVRSRTVHLAWTLADHSDASFCNILRAEGAGEFQCITAEPLAPTASFYDDSDVLPGRTYRYQLELLALNGRKILSMEEVVTLPPAALVLEQNRPNPFNPTTTISFCIPSEAPVHLVIYDTAGRRVRTLIDGEVFVGSREIVWDGRSDAGRLVNSGIYYCRLEAGKGTETRKLVLMR